MAGTPALQISALSPLGFVKQINGFGSGAASVPADGRNWVAQITNTLAYDIGEHLLTVGAGSRGAERFAARGQSMVKGAFEWFLQCEQSATLLGFFFGQDSCVGSTPANTTTVASGGAVGSNTVVLTSGTGYATGQIIQVTHAGGVSETHKILSVSVNTITLNADEVWVIACGAGESVSTVVAPFTHTLSFVNAPTLMTLEDYWTSGQAYLMQDAYIDQLDVTSSKTDWKAKATILGGYNTTFATSAVAGDVATFSGDTTPLEWGDTSVLTLSGAVTAGEADAFSIALKNGVKQFFGAGQYTPTKAAGGIVTAELKMTTLFDSAAAATAYANYVAGTETAIACTIGPVTANGLATAQQVWTFPNARTTQYPKKYTLADLFLVDVTARVRIATGATCVITNKEGRCYM